MLFAVAVMAATPDASVTADALDNAAVAPVDGTENDIGSPTTGFPSESVIRTCSVAGNAVPATVVADAPGATALTAYGGHVVWSRLDPATGRWQLVHRHSTIEPNE